MEQRVLDFFKDINLELVTIENTTEIILTSIIVIILTIISQKIAKTLILHNIKRIIDRTNFKWDNILYERKVFQYASHIIPALLIIIMASIFLPAIEKVIKMAGGIYLAVIVFLLINSLLNALSDILRSHPRLKRIPINSYIQVIKIILFIFFGLILFGDIVLDESFIVAFVGGLGGISAVSLIVFKDTITGFLAGIILTINEMVKVGDWISVPQHNADGEVIDMTLNTVKVKNWDNSITTIPPYSLLTDSFINWRSMEMAKARRIKRFLYVDISSIKQCDDELLTRLGEKYDLKDHISSRCKNKEYSNITNIGLLRVYLENYLKKHPSIRKDLTCMVRQLQPTEKGVPIEIYAFTNTTVWVEYEKIQADIIDNIIATIHEFQLDLFQSPTGRDIIKLR